MPGIASTSRASLLLRHPETPSRGVEAVKVRVSGIGTDTLVLTYTLTGDLGHLRIPPPAAPRQAVGLWRRTCFEAFVGMKHGPAYYEFNFSPSGEWAVYGFRGYRDGGLLGGEEVAPKISVRSADDRLELAAATMRLERLSLVQPGTILRLGLSAVIEANDGSLSYWALKHPAERPDFHHPDSFALELALPVESA